MLNAVFLLQVAQLLSFCALGRIHGGFGRGNVFLLAAQAAKKRIAHTLELDGYGRIDFRLSKDNVKQLGRFLGKLSHAQPVAVLEVVRRSVLVPVAV